MNLLEIFLLSILFLGFSQAHIDTERWTNGKDCSGVFQSPVHIKTKDVEKIEVFKVAFNFERGDINPTLVITNDGQTVYVGTDSTTQFAENVVINEETYTLITINYHWGDSEHKIDEEEYCGEIELIFTVNGVDVENVGSGKIVIVSVLLKPGSTEEEIIFLKSLMSKVDQIVEPGKVEVPLTQKTFSLEDLKHNDDFYMYTGSMTTVPCTENVIRIILKDPLSVTDGFIKKMQTVKSTDGHPLITSLNRGLTPLSDINIYKSFD